MGNLAMGTEAFTIRSDSKKVKQLNKLASQMDRSRNYLVNQAIDQLLEIHAWQVERIKYGVKAADKGRLVLGSFGVARILKTLPEPISYYRFSLISPLQG